MNPRDTARRSTVRVTSGLAMAAIAGTVGIGALAQAQAADQPSGTNSRTSGNNSTSSGNSSGTTSSSTDSGSSGSLSAGSGSADVTSGGS